MAQPLENVTLPRRELKAQGFGATEIAKALSIGRASVYRVLEEQSGGRT